MSAPSAPAAINPVWRVIGALLVLPALILWLVQLVIPTVRTMIMSLQKSTPIRTGPSEFVGLVNYSRVFEVVAPALPRTLLFAGPVILISILLGLLIGSLAARGTRPVRMITRGILGLGLVLYAPVGIALTFDTRLVADPGTAVLALTWITTVTLLALPASAAALVSIAAWRSASGLTTWLAAAGLMLCVGLGLAVQLFAIPYAVTGGGPNRTTDTLQTLATTFGFGMMNFGSAAAISVLIGLIAGVFGLLAVLIILIARLRIEIDPPAQPDHGSGLGWAGLGVAGLFLVIMVVVLAPWLAGSATPWSDDYSAVILINTWLPSLIGTLIQIVVALAAGFGLGALRPLGRFSEAGLLIFAPWLLVGAGPLMLQHFDFLRQLDLLGTFAGLLPSTMISVPALVGFTLLFAAVRRLRDSGVGVGAAVVPVLGVLLTTFAVLWLTQAQSLLGGLVGGTTADSMTGPLALATARNRAPVDYADLPQSLSTPLIWLILLGLGAIAVQALCLDRLRLATGPHR
ncbi:sugar ABC transporter permease [Microlunatus speluncae]|uniref:sugar ABC transporter permease n=1 Tax=Microlunatus speluncae TaxID=2594267 RepID=UPI0012662BD0|nr:sugar ABC transporter permease [Microlunatus speluncae]